MNQINNSNKLYIAGAGMITPVGANTAMTVAAVNAGINQYQGSKFYNRRYQPMTTAVVPHDALPPINEKLIAIGLSGREKRLIQMATPALAEVMSTYSLEEPIPLFLAGPEILASGAKPITAKILGYIATQTGANLDLRSSRYFATGRVGVIEAIELAFRYFSATDAKYILVGGVDSYLDMVTLGYLDQQDRILAEDVNDGFAPGEGAGFLLLRSYKYPPQETFKIALFPPGLSVEKGHRYSNQPYLGEGLAGAFTAAITNGTGEKISTIFSSVNGENFFAKEYGVATIRNKAALSESYTHEHPIDCFGDLGAATAPVLIAIAQHNMMRTKQLNQNLIYCSSDLTARAAVCLARVG